MKDKGLVMVRCLLFRELDRLGRELSEVERKERLARDNHAVSLHEKILGSNYFKTKTYKRELFREIKLVESCIEKTKENQNE